MNKFKNLSNGLKNIRRNITLPAKILQNEKENVDVSLYIETITGRLIDPSNPIDTDICLDDIAWSLSRIPRFIGHTNTIIPYNVAQHSIYVSELVDNFLKSDKNIINNEIIDALNSIDTSQRFFLPIKALFHDAHEAYFGDIPSPIKRIPELTSIFKNIESCLDTAIFKHFQMTKPTQPEQIIIKFADKLAQSIEGYYFMPSKGKNWNLPKPSYDHIREFPSPLDSYSSCCAFKDRYEYLLEQ